MESARYRLLETVRQYAHERLVESAEGDDARARHLAFYLALAEKARPELVGPEQGAWLARLDLERENLLSAHACCDRVPNGAESGLRLVYAIKPYWLNRGLLGVGYQVTIEALARAGAQARSRARCGGLADAGQLGFYLGTIRGGARVARGKPGDRAGVGRQEARSRPCCSRSEWPASVAATSPRRASTSPKRSSWRESLATSGSSRARSMRSRSFTAWRASSMRPSRSTATWSPLRASCDDREIVAIGLLNLAMVSIGRGSTDACARDAARSARDRRRDRLQAGRAKRIRGFRRSRRVPRRMDERRALLWQRRKPQARKTGLRRDPTDEAFLAPRIAQARAALGPQAFAAAEPAPAAYTYDNALSEVREWLQHFAETIA